MLLKYKKQIPTSLSIKKTCRRLRTIIMGAEAPLRPKFRCGESPLFTFFSTQVYIIKKKVLTLTI